MTTETVVCVCVHVIYYLRRRLASKGMVMLGVTLCVCPLNRLCHVSTACCISLGGEGNALCPVLSSSFEVAFLSLRRR